jgi:hypothetical protein
MSRACQMMLIFFSNRTMCVNHWDLIFREVQRFTLSLHNLVWSLNPSEYCFRFITCLQCPFYQNLSASEFVFRSRSCPLIYWGVFIRTVTFVDFINKTCSWITWWVLIKTLNFYWLWLEAHLSPDLVSHQSWFFDI